MALTRNLGLVAVLAICAGGADTASAERVYRWVDAQGKVSFSDQPPATPTEAHQEPPRLLDVDGPPLQNHSADTRHRLDENRRWFDQRAQERQAEDARRASERARQARVEQQWQAQCDRAQQKLDQAIHQYEVQRRTWHKPASKRRLKDKIELQRAEVKRRCNS